MLLAVLLLVITALIVHLLIRLYLECTYRKCKSYTCLVGKTILVTGANGAIGYQTALALAARGCRLIIADKYSCETTKENIIQETGNTNITTKTFDLSSLLSIKALAEDIIKTEPKLDVLINNAGNAFLEDNVTENGLNLSMQVNHFGPFALTFYLLDHIKQSSPSRIIFVVSRAAFFARIDVHRLDKPKQSAFNAYACAKLCTMATVPEFVKRLSGTGVTVNCLHPGIVQNSLVQKSSMKVASYFLTKCLYWLYAKNAEQGAQTSIYLAVAKEVEKVSGKYFVDCSELHMPQLVNDLTFRQRIWSLSEQFANTVV